MAVPRVQSWPQQPFSPDSAFSLPGVLNENNGWNLAVTATSGRQAISLNGAFQVELYNAGSFDCAFAFGDATVVAVFPTASTGNYVIGAGQRLVITIPTAFAPLLTNLAAICSGTNTTTLQAFPGVGAS